MSTWISGATARISTQLPRLTRALRINSALILNSGWLLLDKVLRIVISLVVGAWVARYLGPSSYGELMYVLALIALFQSAASLGLDGPLVRDIAQHPDRTDAILGSAFRLRLAAGVAAWIAALGWITVLRPGDHAALVMMALAGAALIFQPADLVDLWFQSQHSSRTSIPYRIVAYCVVAAAKVALIVSSAPVWAFAAAALLDAALVAGAMTFAYRRRPFNKRWLWDKAWAIRLVSDSWPLMLSAIAVGIYMRIDQVMLRELASERELGLYSAILPFSQAWHMIPMVLCASLLPPLAKLRAEGSPLYTRRLQQVFDLMAWLGIGVAGLTALLAPWMVNLLLGAQYADAVPILQWHAVSNVFIFLGVAQSLSIVTERAPRIALVKTLFGVVVNVAANLALIPRWGALGAAFAATITQCASAVLSNAIVAPGTFRMQIKSLLPIHVVRN